MDASYYNTNPYTIMNKISHIKLAATGFLQVFFVSISTYMISHGQYIGAFIAAFMISYIWSINVKKISIASRTEQIIYSLGAATGCIAGLFLSQFITSI